MAKVTGLLSLCLTAMEKVQQLIESECVAATYGCKQGGLLCSQTLTEKERSGFHVSVRSIFFTDVLFLFSFYIIAVNFLALFVLIQVTGLESINS